MWRVFVDVEFVDLAVVSVEVAVLQGVLDTFEGVVGIASAFVWRIEFDREFQWPQEGLPWSEEGNCALAEAFAIGREEDAFPGVAIVMVDARRPREAEGYLAQGTALVADSGVVRGSPRRGGGSTRAWLASGLGVGVAGRGAGAARSGRGR